MHARMAVLSAALQRHAVEKGRPEQACASVPVPVPVPRHPKPQIFVWLPMTCARGTCDSACRDVRL